MDNHGANEEIVRKLIYTFYSRVRENEELGPIFARVIGEDRDEWQLHLEKMVAFWSAVMGISRRYRGNPMQAHMDVGDIRPEHFEVWLRIFRATAQEVCEPPLASLFISRAEQIGRNLRYGLFLRDAEFS